MTARLAPMNNYLFFFEDFAAFFLAGFFFAMVVFPFLVVLLLRNVRFSECLSDHQRLIPSCKQLSAARGRRAGAAHSLFFGACAGADASGILRLRYSE